MTADSPEYVADDVKLMLQNAGKSARREVPQSASASKGSSAYQVHTYPTKVPPGAIEPFIVASTEPGAVVLDPFCGSGMTGLAAQNVGRRAILSDLAPGAVHLAQNHTRPVAPELLARAITSLTAAMSHLELSLYRSACPTCAREQILRHVVWSDVHACASCGREIRVWDQTDDTGGSSRTLVCSCGHSQTRSGMAGVPSHPVEKAVACESCRKLQRGAFDDADRALLRTIAAKELTKWAPAVPMGPNREMYRRSALHLRGIADVRDFWNKRSLLALAAIWEYISKEAPEAVRAPLQFAFTNTAWHATRMRRYNARGGQRPLTGTLYIPQLVAEGNVFEIFRHQVVQLSRFYEGHSALGRDDLPVLARRSSATSLSWLPTGSIPFVFTDPPFGANLFYGDCNIVWESWLGDVTALEQEIVVNRSLPQSAGGKTLEDYERLLGDAFTEIHRVLAPGARASVVFHNSDDRVWSALLNATSRANLVQTDVSLLDKVQRSMKGYKGRSGAELVPFYDLVITFAKQAGTQSARLNGAGDIALSAVKLHLKSLPTVANEATQHQRSLEYLYSLSVGAVIGAGHQPVGLSFRALEELLHQHLESDGRLFYVS